METGAFQDEHLDCGGTAPDAARRERTEKSRRWNQRFHSPRSNHINNNLKNIVNTALHLIHTLVHHYPARKKEINKKTRLLFFMFVFYTTDKRCLEAIPHCGRLLCWLP
jgi:hypothetical protein